MKKENYQECLEFRRMRGMDGKGKSAEGNSRAVLFASASGGVRDSRGGESIRAACVLRSAGFAVAPSTPVTVSRSCEMMQRYTPPHHSTENFRGLIKIDDDWSLIAPGPLGAL